jgi:hypothetical protein
MLKVYYRQKFRVRNTRTGAIVNLNQTVNKNGDDIFTGSFNTLDECQKELDRYLKFVPHYKPYFRIESYSDTVPHDLDIKDKAVHEQMSKMKLFSGKGLAENTRIPKKDENRYAPGKWYGKEVNFAQSIERNKGLSLISKLGDKKSHKEGNDMLLFFQLEQKPDQGEFTNGGCIVDRMRERFKRGEFANRKEMKDYLKTRGYSCKSAHRICNQMFI